jgi:hypothetical protein
MVPFTYSSERPIRYLPGLLKKYNNRGGSIVEFQRVVSCLILSRKSSHYVWVPPNGSRALRSLPDTLTTLLFGWWSLYGFFWTIEVLFTNLGGGRDATRDILKATGGGDVALAQAIIDEEIADGRRESVRAILQFLGIIATGALVVTMVVKLTEGPMNKPGSNYPALPQPVHARPAGTPGSVPAWSANGSRTTTAGSRTTTMPPTGSSKPESLQAIFYNPKGHSTAIIDGTTRSVGQRVGPYTLVAIELQTVTLQSASGEKLILRVGGR